MNQVTALGKTAGLTCEPQEKLMFMHDSFFCARSV